MKQQAALEEEIKQVAKEEKNLLQKGAEFVRFMALPIFSSKLIYR